MSSDSTDLTTEKVSAEKLSLAAEELVKAACVHVENSSIQLGLRGVEELKKMSKGLSNLNVNSASIKESFDTQINTYNKDISDMKNDITDIKQSMTKLNDNIVYQNKIHAIEWGLNNLTTESPLESFKYKDSSGVKDSTTFARNALVAFRAGGEHGVYLPIEARLWDHEKYYSLGKQEQEKLSREVYDKLTYQIEVLIGTRPRIGEASDGKSAIFYA